MSKMRVEDSVTGMWQAEEGLTHHRWGPELTEAFRSHSQYKGRLLS